MDFLPKGYDVPNKAGNYMKFVDGANRFRVLASPIIGWEFWVEDEKGNRKPVRHSMDNPPTMNEVPDLEKVKHFWAMPVYNYQEEKVQILEVTQKGIQKSLKALAKDEDWGSPVNYDVVVTKTGQKLETEYSVQPKPAKPLEKAIKAQFEGMKINLEALFSGDDPFAGVDNSEKINPDEIPL